MNEEGRMRDARPGELEGHKKVREKFYSCPLPLEKVLLSSSFCLFL